MIATALTTANPGEPVLVLLPNGEQRNFTAANVVNTGEVQIHGNYCYGTAPPRVQTVERNIFKARPSKPGAIACQLVAASIWRGRVPLKNVNHIPPYDVAPYENRSYDPPYQSWSYVEGEHLCRAEQDGSGEYETKEACLSANIRDEPDESFSFSRVNYEAIPFYSIAPNGDRVVTGTIGYEPGGLYKQKIFFSTSIFFAGTTNWLYLRWLDNDGTERITTRSLFDGSIKVVVPGEVRDLREEDYIFDSTSPIPFWRRDTTADFTALAELEHPTFRKIYPQFDPSFSTNGQPNLPPERILEFQTAFSPTVAYDRNITAVHLNHENLYGFFVKFHDPDLPAIKAYEHPSDLLIRPYFVFLGTKAYLIVKIGKIRAPDLDFESRPWYQIKVIEIYIDGDALAKRETDYFYPDLVVSDSFNVLSLITDRYTVGETGDACLDDEDYFLRVEGYSVPRYREVNYHRSPNKAGVTVVHKVPGVLIIAD